MMGLLLLVAAFFVGRKWDKIKEKIGELLSDLEIAGEKK